MRLIVQPDEGLAPILEAVRQARRSIDVMIFRFDRRELEKALAAAVQRRVAVRALIAHTANAGERALRKLEARLLDAGLTIARTDDDLRRYHAKYLIVDRARLFVLGFNFTALDMAKSRSFGIEIRARALVQDVLELFEADVNRQPEPRVHRDLVISPVNARERLSAFIRGAKRELLIYDPRLSDPRMIRLLRQRIDAGVAVRVVGRVAKGGRGISCQRAPRLRLHVRAIMRDGAGAFVGSLSLRRADLDERRELGVIVRDPTAVRRMIQTFNADWQAGAPKKGCDCDDEEEGEPAARKIAKAS
jgi:phosphatidylserine/phosphatidylglycerophosphate/cardiolipin synthase-like enzyme